MQVVAVVTRALTVRQPWATSHRGWLAIHAAVAMRDFWRTWDTGHQHAYGTEAAVVQALTPLDIDPMLGDDCLPTGAIVATARLVDCVPIMEGNTDDGPPAKRVESWDGEGSLWLVDETLPEDPGADDLGQSLDVTGQLPGGDFTPGRWAWLLGDVAPTTERCPACLDSGLEPGIVPCAAHRGQPMHEACFACWNGEPCPACDGTTRCDPIPARGRQGVWGWAP